jgi:hypothetical protein
MGTPHTTPHSIRYIESAESHHGGEFDDFNHAQINGKFESA